MYQYFILNSTYFNVAFKFFDKFDKFLSDGNNFSCKHFCTVIIYTNTSLSTFRYPQGLELINAILSSTEIFSLRKTTS